MVVMSAVRMSPPITPPTTAPIGLEDLNTGADVAVAGEPVFENAEPSIAAVGERENNGSSVGDLVSKDHSVPTLFELGDVGSFPVPVYMGSYQPP